MHTLLIDANNELKTTSYAALECFKNEFSGNLSTFVDEMDCVAKLLSRFNASTNDMVDGGT